MKTQVVKSVLGLVMVALFSIPSYAQLTYLRNVEVGNFKEIRVSLDTEVIILKSKRNNVTLVGDSSFVNNMPVQQKGDVLTFTYNAEPEGKLKQVVIAYKDIERVVTGGTGNYYFHKVDTEKLDIFNPTANVYLNGKSDKIRVISQEGLTDLTALTSKKGIMSIGESAQLIASDDADYITSPKSLK